MNNKAETITKLILLSIIAIVLTIILIILLVNPRKMRAFDLSGKSELVYDEEITTPIKKLEIETKSADVRIESNNSDKISLKVYAEDQEDIHYKTENETLNIKENKNHFCIGICNIPTTEIIISIPKTQEYEVSLTTVSGDVYIEEAQISSLHLKTTSGDIRVQSAKEAVVTTTSGDISLNKVENLKLTTTSGDAELREVIGSCQIKTTSGDIEIDTLKINRNSKITSVSGDIEIQRNSNSYVKTETVSGEVRVGNNDRYAEAELFIKTTSGDIEVEDN